MSATQGPRQGQRQEDQALASLVDAIDRYELELDRLPVAPDVTPAVIRAHLATYDFADPIALPELVDQVTELLLRWSLHVNHPRYFGLFNPTVRRAVGCTPR